MCTQLTRWLPTSPCYYAAFIKSSWRWGRPPRWSRGCRHPRLSVNGTQAHGAMIMTVLNINNHETGLTVGCYSVVLALLLCKCTALYIWRSLQAAETEEVASLWVLRHFCTQVKLRAPRVHAVNALHWKSWKTVIFIQTLVLASGQRGWERGNTRCTLNHHVWNSFIFCDF